MWYLGSLFSAGYKDNRTELTHDNETSCWLEDHAVGRCLLLYRKKKTVSVSFESKNNGVKMGLGTQYDIATISGTPSFQKVCHTPPLATYLSTPQVIVI